MATDTCTPRYAFEPTGVPLAPPSRPIDAILRRFEPITLAEMDGVSLMNRVDSKYVLSESLAPELLERIAANYRVLEVAGVRRSPYTTLYFDTPTLDCYHEHHRGKPTRRKYRMRNYDASGAAFFEVKQRTNKGRTCKTRVSIPGIVPRLEQEPAALVESVAGRGADLAPQLYTLFSRVTLVGRDAAERVTIDTDLRFRQGQQTAEAPGVIVVEVKQERDRRSSPVRAALRELNVRQMRISKYCLGSILLNPGLKRNRFKEKLLAVSLASNGAPS